MKFTFTEENRPAITSAFYYADNEGFGGQFKGFNKLFDKINNFKTSSVELSRAEQSCMAQVLMAYFNDLDNTREMSDAYQNNPAVKEITDKHYTIVKKLIENFVNIFFYGKN